MSPKPTAPVDKWDIWDELDGSDIHVSSNAPSRDPIQIKQALGGGERILGINRDNFHPTETSTGNFSHSVPDRGRVEIYPRDKETKLIFRGFQIFAETFSR